MTTKKYIVLVPQLYYLHVEVKADSPEMALKMVQDDGPDVGSYNDADAEYSRTFDSDELEYILCEEEEEDEV